jgi:hypothetical protein
MAGAFVYDLYKNVDSMDCSAVLLIAIGFVVAFLSALIVVRGFLGFVSRHGFAPFAYWRIVVGVLGLIAVVFFGAGQAPESAVVRSDRAVALELATRTEAIEIGRQHGFEAGRIDTETLQGPPLAARFF